MKQGYRRWTSKYFGRLLSRANHIRTLVQGEVRIRQHSLIAGVLLAALGSWCQPSLAESIIDYSNDAMRTSMSISPIGDHPFGEYVSPLDGSTIFRVTDVVVQTNSGPLSLGREFDVSAIKGDEHGGITNLGLYHFGGNWGLDIPYIRGVFSYLGWYPSFRVEDGGVEKRCTGIEEGVDGVGNFSPVRYEADNYHHGLLINIPGLGKQSVLQPRANHIRPTNGNAYRSRTKSNWWVECLESIRNDTGEGMKVLLPDGSEYRFDWVATRSTTDIYDSTCPSADYFRSPFSMHANGYDAPTCFIAIAIPRQEITLYATEMKDRFGNITAYEFDPNNPNRLLSISRNGEKLITIQHGDFAISKIIADGREWNYRYDSGNLTVELPDGTAWKYIYDFGGLHSRFRAEEVWAGCNVNLGNKVSSQAPSPMDVGSMTVTNPSGATGVFRFRKLLHGTKQGESGCHYVDVGSSRADLVLVVDNPSVYEVPSLYELNVSGAGLAPNTFSYTYQPGWEAPFVAETKEVDSGGKVTVYKHGTDVARDYGLLLEKAVGTSNNVLRRDQFTYLIDPADAPFEFSAGRNPYDTGWGSYILATQNMPVVEHAITQDGQVFRMTVPKTCDGKYCFDLFVRPTRVIRSSAPAL